MNAEEPDRSGVAQREPAPLSIGWVVSIALAALMSFWWVFLWIWGVFSLWGPWQVEAGVALAAAGLAVGVRTLVDCLDVTIDYLRGVSPDQGTVRSAVVLVVGDLAAAVAAGVALGPDAGTVVAAVVLVGLPMVAVTVLWERPWRSTTAEDAASVERLGASFSALVREIEADRADLPRRYARRLAERDRDRPHSPWPDARGRVHLDPYRDPER